MDSVFSFELGVFKFKLVDCLISDLILKWLNQYIYCFCFRQNFKVCIIFVQTASRLSKIPQPFLYKVTYSFHSTWAFSCVIHAFEQKKCSSDSWYGLWWVFQRRLPFQKPWELEMSQKSMLTGIVHRVMNFSMWVPPTKALASTKTSTDSSDFSCWLSKGSQRISSSSWSQWNVIQSLGLGWRFC